jgi:AcrR family transcriptional regulator
VARKRKANRREQITNAAIQVFAEKGFYQSRISDIAERAGVAYGLVYHYFANKEEILLSIFVERWAVILQYIEDTFNTPTLSAEEKLREILKFIFTIYKENSALAEVIVLEILRGESLMREEVVRGFQQAFRGLSAIIQEGQRKGEFRNDFHPDIFTLFLFGGAEITFTALALKIIPKERMDPDSFSRAFIHFLLHGARPSSSGG